MFKLSEVANMRAVCRKCKRPVIVIDWGYNSVEYRCDQCGYSTVNPEKVEKQKVNELKESKEVKKDAK